MNDWYVNKSIFPNFDINIPIPHGTAVPAQVISPPTPYRPSGILKASMVAWAAEAVTQQAGMIYDEAHATIERIARYKARLADRWAGL